LMAAVAFNNVRQQRQWMMERKCWQHNCCARRDSGEDDKVVTAVAGAFQCSGRQRLKGNGSVDDGGSGWGWQQRLHLKAAMVGGNSGHQRVAVDNKDGV
jgi:hypothetical protein